MGYEKQMKSILTGLFALALILVLPAHAQEDVSGDSAYTVDNIKVDVTDKSAVSARRLAFEKAQGDAFKILAQRLLPAEKFKSFALPAPAQISPLIQDFEITGEQLSTVRYIATYKFRFSRQMVSDYLSNQGVESYADVSSRPVLILPFYQWGSRNVIWGGDNPWLQAWNKINPNTGLVPVVVPIGDLDDVSDISDDQAITHSPANLRRMMARYDAGDALILIAAPVWASADIAGAPSAVDISLYRTSSGSPVFSGTKQVSAQTGESADQLYDRAVAQVRATLQDDWKEMVVADPAQRASIRARVRFGAMKEWVDMQKALKSVQGVNEITLLSLKPGLAQIELAYSGTEERLRLALAQSGIALAPPPVSIDGVAAESFYDLSLITYDAGPY